MSTKSPRLSASQKFRYAIRPPANFQFDKRDLLDVLYWARQLLSVAFGLFYGLTPVLGFLGYISFILVSSSIMVFYCTRILGVEETEENLDPASTSTAQGIGRFEILSEGFMPSVALFSLVWIGIYSAPL